MIASLSALVLFIMIIILFLWGTNKACFSKPQPRTMVIDQGFDAQDSTEVQTMTQTGASIGVGANFGPTKPKSKVILKYTLVKSRLVWKFSQILGFPGKNGSMKINSLLRIISNKYPFVECNDPVF